MLLSCILNRNCLTHVFLRVRRLIHPCSLNSNFLLSIQWMHLSRQMCQARCIQVERGDWGTNVTPGHNITWEKYCVIRVYLQLWITELTACLCFPGWWLVFKVVAGLERQASSQGVFCFSCKQLHLGTRRQLFWACWGWECVLFSICRGRFYHENPIRSSILDFIPDFRGTSSKDHNCFGLSLVLSSDLMEG